MKNKEEIVIGLCFGELNFFCINCNNNFSIKNMYQDNIEKDFSILTIKTLKEVKEVHINVSDENGVESIIKWKHKLKKNFTKYYYKKVMEHIGLEKKDDELLLLNGFDFKSIKFYF